MLFSEPKIPQFTQPTTRLKSSNVSVLFSEPKIPQFRCARRCALPLSSFSALQRAENSSIEGDERFDAASRLFQCSSASRKFLNSSRLPASLFPRLFQCSSASRKFLNFAVGLEGDDRLRVSVLFSEPKIPQLKSGSTSGMFTTMFQCSSASRKFLNKKEASNGADYVRVSVLFSEPKIPQFNYLRAVKYAPDGFSALQRAENSSIEPSHDISSPPGGGFSALQRAENSSIRSA